jgi:hypothetical protein
MVNLNLFQTYQGRGSRHHSGWRPVVVAVVRAAGGDVAPSAVGVGAAGRGVVGVRAAGRCVALSVVVARATSLDDAQLQKKACGALMNLAANDANEVTLMAAKTHVRIVRAMDRHRDDAQVQKKVCGALSNLAFNDANQVTPVAAGAHVRIIRAMNRHQDDAQVQEMACVALWNLATNKRQQGDDCGSRLFDARALV